MYAPKEVSYITPEHFAAFGRIMHAFARIDALYENALCHLLEMESNQAGIAFSQYGYLQKYQMLTAIIASSSLSDDEKKDFEKLAKRIHKKSNIRNEVAHCTWCEGNTAGRIKPINLNTKIKIRFSGISDADKEWSANELHAEADEILSRGQKMSDFLARSRPIPATQPKP